MGDLERFRRGDEIVHRDLHRGTIWYARAEVVVEDASERLVTYWGPGAEVRAPTHRGDGRPMRVPAEAWTLRPSPWHSFHVMSHWVPGDAISVWLFWEASTRAFARWYVNLQAPFVRTPIGFDATDDLLDVEIEPDRSWSLKDEPELEEAVRAGAMSEASARSVRRHADDAVQRMKQGQEPFVASWTEWRPDAGWPVPTLRSGWDLMPPSR